jgi:hypothetical protein
MALLYGGKDTGVIEPRIVGFAEMKEWEAREVESVRF